MILFLTNHNIFVIILLLIPKFLLEIASLLRYSLTANFNGFLASFVINLLLNVELSLKNHLNDYKACGVVF